MRKVFVVLEDDLAQRYDRLKALLGLGVTWEKIIARGLEAFEKEIAKDKANR